MARNKSVPAKDHTGESLVGPNSHPTVADDGAPAREYSNQGDGLSRASGKSYDEAHGRGLKRPGDNSLPAAYK